MASIGRFLQTLWQLLREPTSNITASMLVAAVIATVLLIGIIAVLMLLASGTSEAEEEESGAEPVAAAPEPPAKEPMSPEQKRRRLTEAALVLVLTALVSVVAFGWASGTDKFCSEQCHQLGKGRAAGNENLLGADTAHADVRCVRCHESGGALTIPALLTGRAQHTVTSYLGMEVTGIAGTARADACLACHDDVLKRTVESTETGVKMSHKEPTAAGATCIDCHGSVGHSDVSVIGMTECLRCHDNKTASSECRLCHTKDTSLAIKADRRVRVFARVRLNERRDCEGCHSMASCDKCHGIRMPHSYEFTKYDHARSAGFDRKQMCWRCHTTDDCSKCHSPKKNGVWGHGDNWLSEHDVRPAPVQCACHDHPDNIKGDFCAACH